MLSRVFSAAVHGVEAIPVIIEVHTRGGDDSKTVIVGLPDAAVKESIERVSAAVVTSGMKMPVGHMTINLAPANIRKEGPAFDLPIALGVICAAAEDNHETRFVRDQMAAAVVVGELALNGEVRPVRGVLAVAIEAKKRGVNFIMVPRENAQEAAVVGGIAVIPVATLEQAYGFFTGDQEIVPHQLDRRALFARHARHDVDFNEVKGQHSVKRALEVACAGGHNLLMIGPPGTGKSMLAKRISTIMPSLTEEQAIEATKIHSIAGLLDSKAGLVGTRPFRSPHHTVSEAGMLGGTSVPRPGEVSLAHHGVLFLDELPEFRRSTLEVMRQPLEDGRVTISRAAASLTFPARFMLVAAMNPCPCGYYGDPKRECRCVSRQIEMYRQRISGPLLDRIDIHIDVPLVEYRDLAASSGGEASEVIRERVERARAVQVERFRKEADGVAPVAESSLTNAYLGPKMVAKYCQLDREGAASLEHAMTQLNFSARAHDRILKVARTIADLEGVDQITDAHVMEAIQLRSLDRKLW
ncbi:YifB family Mg chelatase-like AAA ATPase [Sulfuriroseicoccus oceanibius]|uniref:YifB family Mg chelatase-like AAA ATPase n=1 Tax=Sulfuriroseicoccus oceanibius TaxID=2707525 RepID=A0A6B3LAC7_9BACT|nr:YifB family Mg chelatase-like AAA ATPase [Sulfuriroseicoccus oceanibius]QQL46207.1 YifB family Mg chelatase-like AAA ATPase [Sulfuriroseicoccus oceanibius]